VLDEQARFRGSHALRCAGDDGDLSPRQYMNTPVTSLS
jgi:hypothetical protein